MRTSTEGRLFWIYDSIYSLSGRKYLQFHRNPDKVLVDWEGNTYSFTQTRIKCGTVCVKLVMDKKKPGYILLCR